MKNYFLLAGRVALALLIGFAVSHVVDALPHAQGMTGVSMAMGFGAPFRAKSRQQIQQAVTPASGKAQESIWHCLYDTQNYVSTATTRLTFFQTPNVDPTLSNMEAGGQLPSPQSFEIHNICVDFLPAAGISTSATVTGNGNDMALLLLSARPIWTLTISQKAYGPYPLTLLHGTGGPAVFGFSSDGAEILQYSRNDPNPGWNYFGRIIIPEQVGFKIDVAFAAAQTLSATPLPIRLSMCGVLNRRIV